MAIERNTSGGGSYIKEPGEYKATVKLVTTGMSKTQKPMFTITLLTADEKAISAYFVKELEFHMKDLALLKKSAGLKESAATEELLGKEVGILVVMQEPNEQGKVFPAIGGYGPASEVGK